MTRVDALHQIIASQRQLGLNPQELHGSPVTILDFAKEAGLQPIPGTDTRSLMERLRGTATREARYRFDDVLLIANDAVPGAALILRPQMLMGNPQWLQHIIMAQCEAQSGIQTLPADGNTPWHEKIEQVDPQAVGEGTLANLQRDSGVDPTSILIKAMDGMDSVEDVVVLRFHRGGDVTMCATMDRMRIVGALQMAMGYVLRGE